MGPAGERVVVILMGSKKTDDNRVIEAELELDIIRNGAQVCKTKWRVMTHRFQTSRTEIKWGKVVAAVEGSEEEVQNALMTSQRGTISERPTTHGIVLMIPPVEMMMKTMLGSPSGEK